jgi:hypothetical protein
MVQTGAWAIAALQHVPIHAADSQHKRPTASDRWTTLPYFPPPYIRPAENMAGDVSTRSDVFARIAHRDFRKSL